MNAFSRSSVLMKLVFIPAITGKGCKALQNFLKPKTLYLKSRKSSNKIYGIAGMI